MAGWCEVDRPVIVIRERRPRWYLSFEMVCLLLTVSAVSGLFAGVALASLKSWAEQL